MIEDMMTNGRATQPIKSQKDFDWSVVDYRCRTNKTSASVTGVNFLHFSKMTDFLWSHEDISDQWFDNTCGLPRIKEEREGCDLDDEVVLSPPPLDSDTSSSFSSSPDKKRLREEEDGTIFNKRTQLEQHSDDLFEQIQAVEHDIINDEHKLHALEYQLQSDADATRDALERKEDGAVVIDQIKKDIGRLQAALIEYTEQDEKYTAIAAEATIRMRMNQASLIERTTVIDEANEKLKKLKSEKLEIVSHVVYERRMMGVSYLI